MMVWGGGTANFDTNTGGLYDPNKRKDNARIVAEQGITNELSFGNGDLWGTAATAPGGSMTIGPNGSLGNAAWHASGTNGIQPGAFTMDASLSFAPVPTPPGGAMPPAVVTIGGKSAWVLASGVYQVSKLNQTTVVNGNATLLVSDEVKLSDTTPLIVSPGASITVYCSQAVKISATGLQNQTGLAANALFYGMNTCNTVDFNGGVKFIGQIYAPNADMTGGGGGGTPFNFSGSVSAKSLTLSGQITFHYDEALSGSVSQRYYVSSWNEL